ncbi:MAG TPA: methyltransferase domain-containing protein [Aridibacter sp.]|nr:methyltransferase domain-containing protein [Aridibacter sp.]
MNDSAVYQGKDLEAMSFAVNYHRWILDEIRPWLGKRIVEVGAGTGSFSEMLLGERPEALALIEPSGMFVKLAEKFKHTAGPTSLKLINKTFLEAFETVSNDVRPDTVVYVNVLEHIEEDRRELEAVFEALSPGGRCIVFVPAFKWLYSEFDRRVGHCRRYSKGELKDKCSGAGFRVERCGYFDIAGVLPWFFKYRILRSTELGSGAVAAYDRIAVPVMSRIERLVPVPFGKNVLAVARKTERRRPACS